VAQVRARTHAIYALLCGRASERTKGRARTDARARTPATCCSAAARYETGTSSGLDRPLGLASRPQGAPSCWRPAPIVSSCHLASSAA